MATHLVDFAAKMATGFLERQCDNPEEWLGWAPDTFGWNWSLMVTTIVAFIGGAMSASVGVGGYVIRHFPLFHCYYI